MRTSTTSINTTVTHTYATQYVGRMRIYLWMSPISISYTVLLLLLLLPPCAYNLIYTVVVAVATVLLLAAAARHLHTCHPRCSTALTVNHLYFERTYSIYCSPLGAVVPFVRLAFTYYYIPGSSYVLLLILYQVPLFATAGIRGAAGGRQPVAAQPPSWYWLPLHFWTAQLSQSKRFWSWSEIFHGVFGCLHYSSTYLLRMYLLLGRPVAHIVVGTPGNLYGCVGGRQVAACPADKINQ